MAKISKILLVKKKGCGFCDEVLEPTQQICNNSSIQLDVKYKEELPKELHPGIYPYWYIFDETGHALWHYHQDMEGSFKEAIDEIQKP